MIIMVEMDKSNISIGSGRSPRTLTIVIKTRFMCLTYLKFAMSSLVKTLPDSLKVRPGDIKIVELFLNSTLNLQSFKQVNVSLSYSKETTVGNDLIVNIVPLN